MEGERILCDWAAMLLDNVEMFGLKPERLTQKVLGLANVKEACLFPRDCRRVRL